MKLTNIRRVAREEVPDAPDWIDRLITPYNNWMEQGTQAINGNLSLPDNILCKIRTDKFTHGTELIIANPLPTPASNVGLEVHLCDSASYIIGQKRIVPKPNNNLGITVLFDIPDTGFFLTRNANQLIGSGADTAINWVTSNRTIGPGLSWSAATNPSRVTCVLAGRYHFDSTVAFEANATGERSFFVAKNASFAATATQFGRCQLDNVGAGVVWVNSTGCYVDLAVNDFVELYCFQNSGGNLNALGNNTAEVQFMGQSVSPLSSFQANVKYVLYVT